MHNTSAPRDSGDELLARLRLRNTCYCQSLLRAPWGLSMPDQPGAAYYIFVARGQGVYRVGEERRTLSTGDFLFLPHGTGYELAHAADTPTTPIDELAWQSMQGLCIVRIGGEGPETHIMTGSLEFEVFPLLPALPTQLLLQSESSERDTWLCHTVDAMVREAENPRMGTEVVLSRFAEVLSVGAIRHWLEAGEPSRPGLSEALADAPIRSALELIHSAPERQWTLSSLARAVGMSRTVFASRFNEYLAISPIKYWTRWRLSLAAQWLRSGELTIDEAADRLSYSSRAAFSRAFKNVMHVAPGAFARAGRRQLKTMNEHLDHGLQQTHG